MGSEIKIGGVREQVRISEGDNFGQTEIFEKWLCLSDGKIFSRFQASEHSPSTKCLESQTLLVARENDIITLSIYKSQRKFTIKINDRKDTFIFSLDGVPKIWLHDKDS